MTCTCGWQGAEADFPKHFEPDAAAYHSEQIATTPGLPEATIKANAKLASAP